jgi:hypothetical protein
LENLKQKEDLEDQENNIKVNFIQRGFLPCWPVPPLRSSLLSEPRWLRGAFDFCRRINMLGCWLRSEWSNYGSQFTGLFTFRHSSHRQKTFFEAVLQEYLQFPYEWPLFLVPPFGVTVIDCAPEDIAFKSGWTAHSCFVFNRSGDLLCDRGSSWFFSALPVKLRTIRSRSHCFLSRLQQFMNMSTITRNITFVVEKAVVSKEMSHSRARFEM